LGVDGGQDMGDGNQTLVLGFDEDTELGAHARNGHGN
jgi:hypothetical protein